MSQDTIAGLPGHTIRVETPGTALASKTYGLTTVLPISSGNFGFSAPQLAAAERATITCYTNNCNILWDGSTPTTTFGHTLVAGVTTFVLEGNAKINSLQLVSAANTSNVTITLEKY